MVGKLGCLELVEELEQGHCIKIDSLTCIALRHFIEHMVANVFDVTANELHAGSRGRANVAFARQVAMYLGHVTFGISMHDVGVIFARDRTTVAHACAVVEDARDDAGFDRALDMLGVALHVAQGGVGQERPAAI